MEALTRCIGSDTGGGKVISPLRQQMIDDMNLAGLSPNTQQRYIKAVTRLQRATGVHPTRLTEAELRKYLIGMRDIDEVARGTFQANFFGLKFFYYRVLDLDWSIFVKKRLPFLGRNGFPLPCLWMNAIA